MQSSSDRFSSSQAAFWALLLLGFAADVQIEVKTHLTTGVDPSPLHVTTVITAIIQSDSVVISAVPMFKLRQLQPVNACRLVIEATLILQLVISLQGDENSLTLIHTFLLLSSCTLLSY